MKRNPEKNKGSEQKFMTEDISSNEREPKYKYINDIPSSKKQDINPPNTKYLIPASVENSELRLKVAKIYNVRLCNSIAK